MENKGKTFRDPIHDFIYVDPIELEIINTPVFQRLHNVKQLSLGYYVYHGAEHSRFGHTIGAMHLAGLAFDAMKKNTIELGESFEANDLDRQTLRIAALLHDVGHAPFSHSLENVLHAKHEDYSKALAKNFFSEILAKASIDTDIVCDLIDGAFPKKPFLSKIISGQLDVDRLDYLLRDSHFAGVTYGKYDLGRIINQLAVIDRKFVVLQGGYEAVEQLIFARYQMYQQVYFHKTKRAFELMLWKCADILKNSDLLKFPTLKELENTEGVKKFVECDDRWLLNKIYDEGNPNSVKIIANMIDNRKPYWGTYSPVHRQKSSTVKTTPDDSAKHLEPIQKQLLNKLKELKIEDYEFLTDDVSRSPYRLMPDYMIAEEENEGNSISIYYKNNKFIEPIEKRSHVVFTLATNQPSMMRGFVIPKKYDIVRDYLKSFDYIIPEREQK